MGIKEYTLDYSRIPGRLLGKNRCLSGLEPGGLDWTSGPEAQKTQKLGRALALRRRQAFRAEV